MPAFALGTTGTVLGLNAGAVALPDDGLAVRAGRLVAGDRFAPLVVRRPGRLPHLRQDVDIPSGRTGGADAPPPIRSPPSSSIDFIHARPLGVPTSACERVTRNVPRVA